MIERTIEINVSQGTEEIGNMLEKVVSEGGGKKAGVEGYRIAGKTGVLTRKCV